jgi:hypothetical protein
MTPYRSMPNSPLLPTAFDAQTRCKTSSARRVLVFLLVGLFVPCTFPLFAVEAANSYQQAARSEPVVLIHGYPFGDIEGYSPVASYFDQLTVAARDLQSAGWTNIDILDFMCTDAGGGNAITAGNPANPYPHMVHFSPGGKGLPSNTWPTTSLGTYTTPTPEIPRPASNACMSSPTLWAA